MNRKKKFSYNKIIQKEDSITQDKRNYLHERGWETKSSFPGGKWLWIKEINGEKLAIDIESAFYMQGWMDNL